MKLTIKFCWLSESAARDLSLPSYETVGSAGMDVEAGHEGDVTLEPGDICMIPTGFGIEIPAGYEVQVRPRSGLAVKHGITVVNSPGTIDSDYRGEVKIGLINLGRNRYTITRGDRIAQLVVAPVVQARFDIVSVLASTARGSGGFGSTGW